MSIVINDRRRPLAPGSLGTGGAVMSRNADEVMVQPLEPYMEGHEHKNARSQPYGVPRHHALELEAQGFAKIVEPKKPVEADPPAENEDESDEEPDTEQPDDESGQARSPRRRGRPPGRRG